MQTGASARVGGGCWRLVESSVDYEMGIACYLQRWVLIAIDDEI
jgi:hypothetical protein